MQVILTYRARLQCLSAVRHELMHFAGGDGYAGEVRGKYYPCYIITEVGFYPDDVSVPKVLYVASKV